MLPSSHGPLPFSLRPPPLKYAISLLLVYPHGTLNLYARTQLRKNIEDYY